MTLTEFLLDRIADDERVAHNALGLLGVETDWHTVEQLRSRGLTRADAQHVSTWSSRRVLAECEAKRRIVAEAVRADEAGDSAVHTPGEDALWMAFQSVLAALALPYADHSDYREEWRP